LHYFSQGCLFRSGAEGFQDRFPKRFGISENPGPEVAVQLFSPPQVAPMTADIEAILSSIWINIISF